MSCGTESYSEETWEASTPGSELCVRAPVMKLAAAYNEDQLRPKGCELGQKVMEKFWCEEECPKVHGPGVRKHGTQGPHLDHHAKRHLEAPLLQCSKCGEDPRVGLWGRELRTPTRFLPPAPLPLPLPMASGSLPAAIDSPTSSIMYLGISPRPVPL